MMFEGIPVILAVDDTPANLDVLIEHLNDQYRVKIATCGESALKIASTGKPPDIILLDIMMPDMDGFEVCRQLKGNDRLRDIPVIFISALEDVDDKVKAFTSGGVDYVTKPFQGEELRSRVSTHITLRRMQLQLEAHNRHLDDLVRQKTHELAEAHQRLIVADKTKGDFLKLISHELRTPANGILGIADVLIRSCSENEDVKALAPYFEESRTRMLSVLDDSLLLAEVDLSKKDFRAETLYLGVILHDAFHLASKFAAGNGVTLGSVPICETSVEGDDTLLKMAFATLIKTAVLFCVSGETVTVRCIDGKERITVIIEGRGKGLNESSVDGFFDVFSPVRSSTHAEPLGLKPAVAERSISLFGGRVSIRNLEPKGVAINISMKKSLPVEAVKNVP